MNYEILLIGFLAIGIFNSFLSVLFLEKFFQLNKVDPAMCKLYLILATLLGITGFALGRICLYELFPTLGTKRSFLLGFTVFLAVFILTYRKYHGKKIPILK